jgi:hypothetical protein
VATPAKVIGCAKLNEKAVVATNDLPGINRGKSGGHLQVGVARAGKTQEPNARFLLLCVMCGKRVVDVKKKRERLER